MSTTWCDDGHIARRLVTVCWDGSSCHGASTACHRRLILVRRPAVRWSVLLDLSAGVDGGAIWSIGTPQRLELTDTQKDFAFEHTEPLWRGGQQTLVGADGVGDCAGTSGAELDIVAFVSDGSCETHCASARTRLQTEMVRLGRSGCAASERMLYGETSQRCWSAKTGRMTCMRKT